VFRKYFRPRSHTHFSVSRKSLRDRKPSDAKPTLSVKNSCKAECWLRRSSLVVISGHDPTCLLRRCQVMQPAQFPATNCSAPFTLREGKWEFAVHTAPVSDQRAESLYQTERRHSRRVGLGGSEGQVSRTAKPSERRDRGRSYRREIHASSASGSNIS